MQCVEKAIAQSLRPLAELPTPFLHQQVTLDLREMRFVMWILCLNDSALLACQVAQFLTSSIKGSSQKMFEPAWASWRG